MRLCTCVAVFVLRIQRGLKTQHHAKRVQMEPLAMAEQHERRRLTAVYKQ